MGFVIFLLLIVVLGAAGYATAIFMTKKQTKVIEELSEIARRCGDQRLISAPFTFFLHYL